MLYVIQAVTGQIVEVCQDGSDVGRFKEPEFLVIKDQKHHDMETEYWDGTEFAPVPEATKLALLKKKKYSQAVEDHTMYLSKLGYDPVWRDYVRGAIDSAKQCLASTTATDAQKAAATTIISRTDELRDFMMKTVGLYMAQVKQAIYNAASIDELEAITWDLDQFTDQDPKVVVPIDIEPNLAVIYGG